MFAMKQFQAKFVLICALLILFIYIIVIFLANKQQSQFSSKSVPELVSKIVIGLVSCRMENQTESNEEALVFIKSVLISAQIYKVEHIEIHLFLEYDNDRAWFRRNVQSLGYDSHLQVDLMFHNALSIVPEQYHEPMIRQHWRRCTYVRLFIPNSLTNVDSMIYFDTDFIITGNIAEIWNEFKKMNSKQMVGAVGNNELKETNVSIFTPIDCFKDVPFFQPRGINAGLLLMNLTKMREFGWEERLLRLYDDYSSTSKLHDQKLINMLFYFNPGRLHLLPCEYNIRCEVCDYGFLCNDVDKNMYGIHTIHGTSENFNRVGRFHYIYKFYKLFNMAKHNVLKDLILPIRAFPEPIYNNSTRRIFYQCRAPINHLLFKNLVDIV